MFAYCCLFSLLWAGAPAGVSFEQVTVTSVDGEAQGTGVSSRTFIAGSKMRLEVGGERNGPALLLHLDTGRAYRIDPARRRVVILDAEALRSRAAGDLGMAGELMRGDAPPRTTPLKVLKTIAGYSCRGYRITAGAAVMDVYVAEAIPVGMDTFAEFMDWAGAARALPGIMAELRKLRGFPLETRSQVTVLGRVHETVSTVKRVDVGPLPADLFELPPDYRVAPAGRTDP